MVFKCCVPYCKSGYASNNIKRSMFIFPKDTEIRNIWIRKISRLDFNPKNSSRVCELHFNSNDVIRFSEYEFDIDGLPVSINNIILFKV